MKDWKRNPNTTTTTNEGKEGNREEEQNKPGRGIGGCQRLLFEFDQFGTVDANSSIL